MYEIYRAFMYANSANAYTLVGSPETNRLEILSGSLDLEVNEAGTLTFTIPSTHTYYGTFKKLEHLIKVVVDTWSTHYFRVIDVKRDFMLNETITCEGVLNVLADTMCLPYYIDTENSRFRLGNFGGTASSYTLNGLGSLFAIILATTPSWYDANFDIGTISITTQPDTSALARESDGSKTCLDEIRGIIEDFGGYVYVSNVAISTDGATVEIGYKQTAPVGKTCVQTIEFGKNLLDIKVEEDVDGLYTSCIGVGEEVSTVESDAGWGNVPRVTAAGYQSSGKVYVDTSYSTILAKYGRKMTFKKFDGLTTSYNVYKAARSYINTLISQNITIEIKAIDLRAVDSTQDGFTCGDSVHVVSSAHGIDSTYLCSQAHIDLTDLSQTSYVFGKKYKKMSMLIGKR